MTFKEIFQHFDIDFAPHDLISDLKKDEDSGKYSMKGFTQTKAIKTNALTWYHFKNYKHSLIIDEDDKVLLSETIIKKNRRHARLITVNFFPKENGTHNLDTAELTKLFFILSKNTYKDLVIGTCIVIDYSYLSFGAAANHKTFIEAKKLARLSNIKSIVAAPYSPESPPIKQTLGHFLSEIFFNMTLVSSPKEANERTIFFLKQILQID